MRVSARTFTHKTQTQAKPHAHTTHDTRNNTTHVTRSNQLPSPPPPHLADRFPPLCPHPNTRFNSVSDHHAAFTRCLWRIPRYRLSFFIFLFAGRAPRLYAATKRWCDDPSRGVLRLFTFITMRQPSSLLTTGLPTPTHARARTLHGAHLLRVFPFAPHCQSFFTSTASQDGLTSLVRLHGPLALLDARSKVAQPVVARVSHCAFPLRIR
jgi:hypothetical protein